MSSPIKPTGNPSWESASGTLIPQLPPADPSDTYDWSKIQNVRQGAVLFDLSATTSNPPFTQTVTYTDPEDKKSKIGSFKVDASPKWFTIINAGIDANGQVSVTLGTIAGKYTGAGRVVRVGSVWSGVGMPGSGKTKEYYYQVS